MNNPFSIKPTRMILQGDKELAADYAGEAKKMIFQLRNIQKTNQFIQSLDKKYEDGTTISVHSKVKGMDIININVNPSSKKGYWELIEEKTQSDSIVPIFEVKTLASINANEYETDTPDGFVVYDVSEGKIENIIASTFDIGETPDTDTTRNGFCSIISSYDQYSNNEKIEKTIEIVELKRYDEAYYSYRGREDWRDTPSLEAFWDIEDSGDCDPEYMETLFDPGRRPEDVFAELPQWEPCVGNGYYGDFVYVSRGVDPLYCGIKTTISGWWPDNFYQKYSEIYNYKLTSWIANSQDDNNNIPTSEFSDIFIQDRTDYVNKTYYGIVWDLTKSGDRNVTNNVGDPNALTFEESGEGFGMYFVSDGTYVKDNHAAYIFIGTKCGQSHSSSQRGYSKGRRNARIPEYHFGDRELTAEQYEILEGNGLPDVGTTECEIYLGVDPEQSSWTLTGEYYWKAEEGGDYHYVNVCGKEYKIEDSYSGSYTRFGVYPDRQRTEGIISFYSDFNDIGIFCDSSEAADKIEPDAFVYVYSMYIPYSQYPYDLSEIDITGDVPQSAWMGMVYKDVNYIMGPLELNDLDTSWTVSYKPNEEIKDDSNETVYFTGKIRVGKKVEKTKRYKWVSYE